MLLSAHLSQAPHRKAESAEGRSVSAKRLHERIVRRAKAVGLDLPETVLAGLEAYFAELARWNRKINLTALALDGDGSDEAVDRFLIEPAVASKYIPASAKSLLDIGSGGGSPAVPIKLCRPDLALTMVEVKVRKSVFLRQVSRLLGLDRTQVETSRFEELLARPDLHESHRRRHGARREDRRRHLARHSGVSQALGIPAQLHLRRRRRARATSALEAARRAHLDSRESEPSGRVPEAANRATFHVKQRQAESRMSLTPAQVQLRFALQSAHYVLVICLI